MVCGMRRSFFVSLVLLIISAVLAGSLQAAAQPEFPPLSSVLKGYEKVISTADGQASLYTIWIRKKDNQMLAALPAGYASRKYFIALTIASGEQYAGLQAGDKYVYWRRYDKRLALIEPNVAIRSNGDQESRSSVKRLFTDRVILDVPIITMSGASPVIDMDALLVGQASKFFGPSVRIGNPRLVKITKAKAFPKNVELAFEVPSSGGRLKTLYYSISEIPDNTGYRPRKADERVGYFTTYYSDYGKYQDSKVKVRYINRWFLEKADPSLAVSPPKKPIVFYIEHTTPVRYRRWVRQGILYWNKAFEKVGFSNAIEVYYQDEESGAHMDKDPEDVRYNFIRWLNNNVGTAIGPSRVHPRTGQILDADIILTDGWIRHFWNLYHEVMPEIAMEGFDPQVMAWLCDHPNWDPRVRLAPPSQREGLMAKLSRQALLPYAGHPLLQSDASFIGDDEYDGLFDRTSQVNGMCKCAQGIAFDVALFRMQQEIMAAEQAEAKKGKSNGKKVPKKKEPMIDGMPESFIGPVLAEVVCHEVGHTLGLRHNFKGSALYSLKQINSKDFKGHKVSAASVMDYLPVNMNFQDGQIQGDYAMIGVGPYDMWAIQYGYTPNEAELPKILNRVSEPELQYATDEDTMGPDPLARRYDFGKDPLEYARNQIRIARHDRSQIISKFVKDGDSWAKARRGYEMTLSMQMRAVSMMANWIGGDFIYRDKKGDPHGRVPIEVVPAKKQRDALKFVIENTFRDEAYGLTTDLLRRMTVDKWWDDTYSILSDSAWPLHDRILSLQAVTLTMLMNPVTLQRIYDNEYLVPSDQDAFTLPEMLDTLAKAIWLELDATPQKKFTVRQPMISSLRRNLQREFVDRLIDLTKPGARYTSAYKPVSNLVIVQLRQLKQNRIDRILKQFKDKLDPYTSAHLQDVSMQIEKALKAQYVYRNL